MQLHVNKVGPNYRRTRWKWEGKRQKLFWLLGGVHKWRYSSREKKGSHFCGTLYEGLKVKQAIRCDRGGGGSENIRICVTSFVDDPLNKLKKSKKVCEMWFQVVLSLSSRSIFALFQLIKKLNPNSKSKRTVNFKIAILQEFQKNYQSHNNFISNLTTFLNSFKAPSTHTFFFFIKDKNFLRFFVLFYWTNLSRHRQKRLKTNKTNLQKMHV